MCVLELESVYALSGISDCVTVLQFIYSIVNVNHAVSIFLIQTLRNYSRYW